MVMSCLYVGSQIVYPEHSLWQSSGPSRFKTNNFNKCDFHFRSTATHVKSSRFYWRGFITLTGNLSSFWGPGGRVDIWRHEFSSWNMTSPVCGTDSGATFNKKCNINFFYGKFEFRRETAFTNFVIQLFAHFTVRLRQRRRLLRIKLRKIWKWPKLVQSFVSSLRII